jgi:hypothetical protein
MSVEDAKQTRMVQREVSKRHIDITMMDIHVHHGVVYMRGTVKPLRGQNIDLKHEFQVLHRILRGCPGIRDVINEVNIRDSTT